MRTTSWSFLFIGGILVVSSSVGAQVNLGVSIAAVLDLPDPGCDGESGSVCPLAVAEDAGVPVDPVKNLLVVAGIWLTHSSELTVSETGTAEEFGVVLTSQPRSEVFILIRATDWTEAYATTIELKFTPEDWDFAHPVRVIGADDSFVDGTVESFIRLTIDTRRSPPEYGHAAEQFVKVSTVDDDIADPIPLPIEPPVGEHVFDGTGLKDAMGDLRKVTYLEAPLSTQMETKASDLIGGEFSIAFGEPWPATTPSLAAGLGPPAATALMGVAGPHPTRAPEAAAPDVMGPPAPKAPGGESPAVQAWPDAAVESPASWPLMVAAGTAATLLVLLLPRLFTRLKRGTVEAQPTRSSIVDFVRARPWSTTMDVARGTRQSRTNARYHLLVLARHGILRVRRQGVDLCFAAMDESTEQPTPPWQLVLAAPVGGPLRAVAAVRRLREQLNYSRSGAWKALRMAAERGHLRLERRGNELWVEPRLSP